MDTFFLEELDRSIDTDGLYRGLAVIEK